MTHSAGGDALTDVLERHSTLGGRCTCGASLPPERLDTPRWFAEHLANVVRSVIPPACPCTTTEEHQEHCEGNDPLGNGNPTRVLSSAGGCADA